MDFDLSEDARMLTRTVRDFVRKEVAPHAAEWATAGAVPRTALEQLRDLGLMGLLAPESLGGFGLSWIETALVVSTLAESSSGLALIAGWHNGAAVPAAAALVASDPAFESTARQLCAGEALGAFLDCDAAEEPNPTGFELEHTAEGPVVSGSARLVPGAQYADWFFGQIGDEESAVVFAVPASAVTLSASTCMGMGGAAFADATLTQVKPAAIGAWPYATQALVDAAVALGVARAAFDVGARYATERKQFGRPIARFQAIQWMIANGAVAIDAADLLIQSAASERKVGQAEMARQAAVAAALSVTDDALQIHGGYGYTREYPIERFWRDARYLAACAPDRRFDQVIAGAALRNVAVDSAS